MKNFTFKALAALFLFFVFCFSAMAQTNVSGGIYTSTTWTKANSPYIVTDTVVVFPGVTLIIQPGVTVKFADHKRIEIRQANLISNGTITDSITYTSNSASPMPGIYGGVYLNGNGGNGKSFNYCNFKYASAGISTSNTSTNDTIYVKNSNFVYNNFGITPTTYHFFIDTCNFIHDGVGIGSITGSGEMGIANYCTFSNNNYGLGGDISINPGGVRANMLNNCVIDSNTYGAVVTGTTIENSIINNNQNAGIFCFCCVPSTVKNCTIDSNAVIGIEMSIDADSIVNCQINNNGTGIKDPGNNGLIKQCVIENDSTGINIWGTGTSIYCNKICNNITYNLYYNVAYGSNANFQNNYWCSTDSVTIDSLIYDGYDNVNLGLVHFQPVDSIGCYLTGCNLHVSASVTNATCDTCHNGHATAVIANGHPPYTYTWYTSPIQYTATATGLSSGTYQLCVIDGNGCTACNSNIFVDSSNCTGFSIKAYWQNATCSTCNDGSASVSVHAGTAPYKYTWYTSPIQTTSSITGLTKGQYAVCVTDLYGCSSCDTTTVGVGSCSAHFNLYPDTVPHTYTAVNMASGVPPFKYDWNWGDGGPHDTTAFPSHTYSSAGNYTICLSITDSAGCTNTYCNSYYLQRMEYNTMVYVNVVPALATGIQEIVNPSIFVFPNPASDLLTVVISRTTSPSLFNLYNMLGELKYSSFISSQQTNIDISGLANGVYLVEVITENSIARHKFIKQEGNR